MTTRSNSSPVWKHFKRGIVERSGGRIVSSIYEGVFNGEVKGKAACATCGKQFEKKAAIEQVTCAATDCGQTLPDTKVVVCKECGGLYAGPNAHSAANCLKHLKHRHRQLYAQVLREREEADFRIIQQSTTAWSGHSLTPNQREALMKKYLRALQRRLADSEGNPEELRKACRGIEPATLRQEIHLEWHVVNCSVQNETHMWNFVRVSSDATQLKRQAIATGPERIVGPDRQLVDYVTNRIGEYKTMLEERGRSQPWFNKLYAELHLDAYDYTRSGDWLELYVRQSAALTFLGYVANGEMRSSLVFYHTWCVGIVSYQILGENDEIMLIFNRGCYAPPELHNYCFCYLVEAIAKRKHRCQYVHWLIRDHLVSALQPLLGATGATPMTAEIWESNSKHVPSAVPHAGFTFQLNR